MHMKHEFITEKYIVTGAKTIPTDIADALWLFHINPMQAVIAELGVNVYPHKKNAYIPYWWEKNKAKGAYVESEHTFSKRNNTN